MRSARFAFRYHNRLIATAWVTGRPFASLAPGSSHAKLIASHTCERPAIFGVLPEICKKIACLTSGSLSDPRHKFLPQRDSLIASFRKQVFGALTAMLLEAARFLPLVTAEYLPKVLYSKHRIEKIRYPEKEGLVYRDMVPVSLLIATLISAALIFAVLFLALGFGFLTSLCHAWILGGVFGLAFVLFATLKPRGSYSNTYPNKHRHRED